MCDDFCDRCLPASASFFFVAITPFTKNHPPLSQKITHLVTSPNPCPPKSRSFHDICYPKVRLLAKLWFSPRKMLGWGGGGYLLAPPRVFGHQYLESPWRPFFAPRLDFCDFLTALNAIEKTTIFRHGPKSIKSTMKSTLCKWLHDLYQNLTTLNDHLTENVRFRVPLRISKGAKMDPQFPIFSPKGEKCAVVPTSVSILEPTLLFTKPL